MDVTAYHHSLVANAPRIADLDLWSSTDGGQTWRPAIVVPGKDGRYTALISHPVPDTDGSVSLRVSARDTSGGTLSTTVERAYALNGSAGMHAEG
jgi:hypothetical protein